jgi:hypothetical protein
MRPINVKNIDSKQVMTHIDRDHQDFCFYIPEWETTSKEDQDE